MERVRKLAEYVDTLLTPPGDPDSTDAKTAAWNQMRIGKEVLLGEAVAFGAGMCRHRSLLFKVLADEAGEGFELGVHQPRSLTSRASASRV